MDNNANELTASDDVIFVKATPQSYRQYPLQQ